MTLAFRLLAVALALLTAVLAVTAHRRSADSSAAQRSARSSLLLSFAILVGTAPGLLFPSSELLSITGSVTSILLTGAALVLIRRIRRGGLPNERGR